MKIYVLGNQILDEDSIPLKILPKLKKKFPDINFKVALADSATSVYQGTIKVAKNAQRTNFDFFDPIRNFFRGLFERAEWIHNEFMKIKEEVDKRKEYDDKLKKKNNASN